MLIDSKLANESNLIRKTIAYAYQIPRSVARLRARAEDFAEHPPVLVNSIPKSGTHLLLRVARSLPGVVYYGSFLASAPSLSLVPRDQQAINFHISRIAPGEVLGAHLYHSDESADRLKAINACHLFIYRDPRDIVLSEAEYLASMNPWHRMHRFFKSVTAPQERIRMVIEGVPEAQGVYPDLRARLLPYLGWLDEPDVLCLRYEELVGSDRKVMLEKICREFAVRAKLANVNFADLVKSIERNLDHGRSHTFRSGGTEKWRSQMTSENLHKLTEIAGDLFERMGYPR